MAFGGVGRDLLPQRIFDFLSQCVEISSNSRQFRWEIAGPGGLLVGLEKDVAHGPRQYIKSWSLDHPSRIGFLTRCQNGPAGS
jgi:hypothetical protein